MEDKTLEKKPQPLRKMTQQRLKNIGLFYLKRFESSTENLRAVLRRRVLDYARKQPDFEKNEAFEWIEQLLADFSHWGYLNDARYAELKVRDYLVAGKPARYIQNKLKQKGVSENLINEILQNQDYDTKEMALNFAKKKKIGPFRADAESRRENRQKDMGTLIRAGFEYDVVIDVLNIKEDF